jgi:hypothetical protein
MFGLLLALSLVLGACVLLVGRLFCLAVYGPLDEHNSDRIGCASLVSLVLIISAFVLAVVALCSL